MSSLTRILTEGQKFFCYQYIYPKSESGISGIAKFNDADTLF